MTAFFQIFRRNYTALLIGWLWLALSSCNQPATYAPVKVVNQSLPPASAHNRPRTEVTPSPPQAKPLIPQQNASGHPDDNAPANSPPLDSKIDEAQQSRSFYESKNKAPSPRIPVKIGSHKPSVKQPVPKAHVLDNSPALKERRPATPTGQKTRETPVQHTTKEEIEPLAMRQPSADGSKNKKKILQKTSTISNNNKKVLKLNFGWPIRGAVIKNFTQTERKGIDIAGKSAQTVHAAEAGKAVYCGQGLAGYGRLIIIKHDSSYLSAYAHNSQLNIAEGQRVEKGQPIGMIEGKRAKPAVLHFEIRKNGLALNPLTLLPQQ